MPKPIIITIYDDAGDETELSLPSKNEVCSRCNGDGTHVNPNIDGNGITSSEWREICDEDPDFPEDYMGGKYDVACEECGGNKVVAVVDEGALTDEQKVAYEVWCKSQAESARIDAEERRYQRMESGDY